MTHHTKRLLSSVELTREALACVKFKVELKVELNIMHELFFFQRTTSHSVTRFVATRRRSFYRMVSSSKQQLVYHVNRKSSRN